MVFLWSLLYLGRISSSIYSKYHQGLFWSLLRCCIQISKLKNLKGFVQGQMIQMPTWKYDIIELMNMYVFITFKKNFFFEKKYPQRVNFSSKTTKKRSQKKVRNNTESKKTHKQHHNTQTLSEKSMSVTTDRPPGSFMFCRFCLLPCLFELHHVAHLGDFWNSKLNLHCLEVEVSRSKVTPPSSLTNVP